MTKIRLKQANEHHNDLCHNFEFHHTPLKNNDVYHVKYNSLKIFFRT